MERQRLEGETRKGPWTAEEDEILINFVKQNGPRDWSSIKSKGLLPRTGKSCRLRWVNKLRPNLKKGCKFSTEEERLVLDLQASFGNKWAAIASYLPGRTDNDVKNFWSTRQKRLARILRSSSQSSRSQKNMGKTPAGLLVVDEASSSEVPKYSSNKVQQVSFQYELCSCFNLENDHTVNMAPAPECLNQVSYLVDANTSLPIETPGGNQPKLSMPSPISFSQIPQPTPLNLPFSQENNDGFFVGLGEPNFTDLFTCEEAFELGNVPQLDFGLSSEGLEAAGQNYQSVNKDKIAVPDNLFGDLPADLFDYLEAIPRSTSPL